MFYKEKWLTIKLSRHSPQCAKQSIWSQRSPESDCVIKLQPYFHFHNLSRCEAFTFYSMGVWLWRQTYLDIFFIQLRITGYQNIIQFLTVGLPLLVERMDHAFTKKERKGWMMHDLPTEVYLSCGVPHYQEGVTRDRSCTFTLDVCEKKSAQQMDHALRNLECQNASSYKH